MKKIFLILLVILIVAIFIMGKISWCQEEKGEKAMPPETAGMILKQLNEISKNQQEILSEIAQMKEDLKIIKMRTALK